MFGISGTELFIIGVFALIIFGPDKIPALARTVGKFMKEFKKVQGDVESMIKSEMAAVEKASGLASEAPNPEAAAAAQATPEVVASEVTPITAPPVFGDDVDEEEEEEE